jgi:hypothetical protein
MSEMHNEQPLDEDFPDNKQMPDVQAAETSDHLPDEVGQQQPDAGRYSLRPNRGHDYGFRLDREMDDPENSKSYKSHQFLQDSAENNNQPVPWQEPVQSHALRQAVENRSDPTSHPAIVKSVVGIILNQMSAKVGIRKHGKVAVAALFDEFLQLHDLNVFEPRSASSLTRKGKKAALRAISVIKEKRCGRIKGRTVADGRTQKGLYGKEKLHHPRYPPMPP